MLDKLLSLVPRRCGHLPTLLCAFVTTVLVSLVVIFLFCNSVTTRSPGSNLPLPALKNIVHNEIAENVKHSIPENSALSISRERLRKEILPPRMLRKLALDHNSGHIFKVMSVREDFTPKNFSSIIQSTKIVNDFQPEFIIKGDQICSAPSPFLLIIIPSKVEHYHLRKAIRETWMKAVNTNSWPRQSINKTVQFLFLLGKHPRYTSISVNNLRQEDSLYHDIVMTNIYDSYRNLARKILFGLHWVKTYCKNAGFILKLDEDTFVNVPLILELIAWVATQSKHSKFVLGHAHVSYRPRVLRDTRWAVRIADYPLDMFPRYMYGHSYVISGAAIPQLVEMAYHVKLIPTEDAYVTGILSKLTNVARIDATCFTVCCTDLFDCDLVGERVVTMTALDTPEDYHRLWKSIVERKCHPQIAFNYKRRHPQPADRIIL